MDKASRSCARRLAYSVSGIDLLKPSMNSKINDHLANLSKTGQVASFDELQKLVFDFESVLKRFDVTIQSGSELESACCSVLEVLGKHQSKTIRDPKEDIREVFTEVLGIWAFLKKVVRLQDHVCFPQFVPHLNLLNKGTVVQNCAIPIWPNQEANNKIFELLFALALLDLTNQVVLDHPDRAKGDNPDVLATIDGVCWGFACKTIYGPSGKTLFDNLKKGVEQIEAASKVEIGIVVVNLRNAINHDECWPILNDAEYRAGAEPIFRAYAQPEVDVPNLILRAVEQKRMDMFNEIELPNVINFFAGKKALPAFLAFCQTCTSKATAVGAVPVTILTLIVESFGDVQAHQAVFEKINLALHEKL